MVKAKRECSTTGIDFYDSLAPFRDFAGITEDRHFAELPDDYEIFVTDVVDSTGAIEKGRYKDVNTIGAAAIAAAQNALGRCDFPYVFGGDGATLVVPSAAAETVERALSGLCNMAKELFNLQLRVGCINAGKVRERGGVVEVARYELVPGKCIAIFRGGGLTVAERMIKSDKEDCLVSVSNRENADLDGLSCRWNSIPNKRGRIISLLVLARGEEPGSCYRQVLQYLDELYDGSLDEANPVNTPLMSYHTVRECYRDERRYHGSRWTLAFILRVIGIVGAVLIFRFKLPPLFFNPTHYRNMMRQHADHRKFDDMLRMVIDCSPAQIDALRRWIEERRGKGELFYGLHESDDCLITCYVHDVRDGNRIHFIDGGDGGYAMAARQLKAQMRDSAVKPHY